MEARSPLDHRVYYFIDKCMPFGAAISCSHFQRLSNAIAHIVQHRTGHKLVNYLDDYLFAALLKLLCKAQVKIFIQICEWIRLPLAPKKTYWASTTLTFLGLLVDTLRQVVSLPADKIQKGKKLIRYIIEKQNHKATVAQIQQICGFLNFLG